MELQADQHLTLKEEVHSKLTEKRSKFYGWASPIGSEEELASFLERVSKEHHNPTHIVYAYRLRTPEGLKEYCTDDGEPTYSAGQPVLKVLQGNQLENVVFAVIRYFGGVKLGVGGLIRAYSETAKLCVQREKLLLKTATKKEIVRVEYAGIGYVTKIVEELNGTIENMDYSGEFVDITIFIRESLVDRFTKKFESEVPFHLRGKKN